MDKTEIMAFLFSPLSIRKVTLKNRIVVSPMCQYSCEEGFATDWHLVHLGGRAVGGAALVFTEATAVSEEGRISPADLGLWTDEHIVPLKRITRFVTEQGAVPGIQLAHAGRKASHTPPWQGSRPIPLAEKGWKTVGPSALAFSADDDPPMALTREGILKVIADFKAAAQRALKAGFKIIEVHAAHGYLLHEFLSPLSNRRNDLYGGSFENRTRLLLEVVAAIRTVWPETNPLFVRLSASDWNGKGWTIEDSITLASVLREGGVDLVDCSSGGLIPGVKIPLTPGYQVPFAEAIRKESGILTGAVGLITEPEQAEAILTAGQADLIIMARELLRDPYFPLRAARLLGEEVKWPAQYERARPKKGG